MFERLFAFVERYPKKIVAAVLATTAVLGVVLVTRTDIATKTSDLFYPQYIEAFNVATQELDDPVAVHVTIEAQGGASILDPIIIREQDKLFTEIEKRWPVRVESLTTVLNQHLNTKSRAGQKLHVGNISDPALLEGLVYNLWRTDPYEFERFARKGLSNPEAIDTLGLVGFFRSQGAGLLGGTPVETPSVPAARATITARETIDPALQIKMFAEIRDFARHFSDKITVRLYSAGLIVNEADHRVKVNIILVTALMTVLLGFLLWRATRQWFFVWMPLLVLGVMLVWSFGIASLTWSRTFTFLAVVPIPLLLGQTIDNLIHFSERYREESSKKNRRAAARIVFATAGKAAALTTLINVAAFIADMVTSNLRPIREYTYLLVLGIAAAFVFTYLLGGALVVLHSRKTSVESPEALNQSHRIEVREFRWGQLAYEQLRKFRIIVMFVSLAVLVVAGVLITKIDRNHRPTTYMARDFPTYDAYQFEQKNFSVYEPHYILIRGDILNPKVDELIKALEAKLENYPDVEHIQGKVNTESLRYFVSLFDPATVPKDRRKFFGDVQRSSAIINRVLLLNASEIFHRLVHQLPTPSGTNPIYDATVIKFWPKLSDSKRIREMDRELRAVGDRFAPDFKVEVSGEFLALSRTLEDSMNSATVASVATGLFIIVLLSILYRNVLTGLITSLPIVFGAAVGMGVLPVLGIELTPLNATVAVLAVGLGIDYAIQIMARYREELAKRVRDAHQTGPSYQEREHAMATAFGHLAVGLGKAMLMTCAGLFALLLLLPLTGKFGIAASISIIAGYLAALTVVPTLAIRFVRR